MVGAETRRVMPAPGELEQLDKIGGGGEKGFADAKKIKPLVETHRQGKFGQTESCRAVQSNHVRDQWKRNSQGPTRRKTAESTTKIGEVVVDEEGRRVEKGEVADDEVSCGCSMILRQYQRLKKDGGQNAEWQGTRARQEAIFISDGKHGVWVVSCNL